MDGASQVLAQGLPPGVRKTYAALAERGDIALTTLWHRAYERSSIEEKAQSQQYLTPCEEKAVVEFLLQMQKLGQPVRIKYISLHVIPLALPYLIKPQLGYVLLHPCFYQLLYGKSVMLL
jgi:hypothetical protein